MGYIGIKNYVVGNIGIWRVILERGGLYGNRLGYMGLGWVIWD